jgi:hypothetical protein
MTADLTRRTFTLSQRKIAYVGHAYTSQFIGVRAVFTDWEGTQHVGTIERFGWDVRDTTTGTGFPILRTDDGRLARLDLRITVLA